MNFKVFFATFTGHWNFRTLLNVKLLHTFQARCVQLICTVNHTTKCSIRNLGIFTWFLPGTCIPQLWINFSNEKHIQSIIPTTPCIMVDIFLSQWVIGTQCIFLGSQFLYFLSPVPCTTWLGSWQDACWWKQMDFVLFVFVEFIVPHRWTKRRN